MDTSVAESHPLRLLAAAIVGRPVPITYLLQPGALSYTDGERLYLAAHDGVEDRRLELMIQGALLAGHSLAARQLRGIVGRFELRQRYLLLEVERCCRLIEDRLPAHVHARLQHYRSGCVSASPEASLEIARSGRRLPEPPNWFGTLQPWRVLRKGLQGSGQAMSEQKLAQLESQLKKMDDDQEDEDDDQLTRNSFWKLLSSPLGKDGFFSRFMQEVLDMKSSPDKDAANSGVAGSSEMVSGRVSSRVRDITQAIRSNLAVAIPSAFVQAESGAHSYPEWDCASRRYRPHWVNVEEVVPHADEPLFAAGALSGGDQAFQRALASLCLGVQRHRGQPQGDDLVLDQMIRLAIDLRTGHSGDERVYAANLKTRRDLGVQILLDTSSSTLEHSSDGTRVFDLQAHAAWKLCRSFALLGDRVAMHGYNSWGRTLVRFQTLKSFDEPPGAYLEQRLRHLSVAGYTRSGAAIRHATELIDKHAGTPYKLLVLISDGYPYDDQYEGEYAVADTRKAIEEAHARGVACVCISVGSDADEQRLERVYGATNYLAINRSEQMPVRLRRLLESAIAAAAKAGRAVRAA
jgi:nitric oxide reductase activation protein